MDFLAKILGLTTKEETNDLKSQILSMTTSFEGVACDLRLLYKEVSSDVARVDRKISLIKPILKIDDKEGIDFIKGILSKHDSNINTQQSFLDSKKLQLEVLERSARNAIHQVSEASVKINNVLNGLGLDEGEQTDVTMTLLKKVIQESKEKITTNE